VQKTSAMKRISNHFLRSLPIAFYFVLSLSFNGLSASLDGGDPAKGEALFGQCAACHSTGTDVVVGPGLSGVQDRWKGREDLLVQWIQNPAAVAAKDAYAKDLVAKFASAGLMQGQAVDAQGVKDILAYIKTGGSSGAASGATGAEDNKCKTLDELKEEREKNEESDGTIWLIIVGCIIVIIAVTGANISRSLKNAANEREGLPTLPEMSYWQASKKWMWENKKFVSVIGFLVFCYFSVVGYKSLMDIGVYDGYTPDQPIWFSHAIHNCQNEIDCQYCHSSASKSKHAGIPSTNVCMNCHKVIKKGKITGTSEIAKIYDAIGFLPDSGKYDPNYVQKPVVWNKVNNLPDHVYFNHSTHVTVGKVDCKNCHGPQNHYTVGHVPTAEEINSQENDNIPGFVKLEKRPFTMGWCLECHNKKEIDLTNSAYYQDMHERFRASQVGERTLHEIMEDGKATVREMGGWECGKCHY
jgi:cytochrome c2